MIIAGHSNQEIATQYSVTERTVSRWRAEARQRRLETFRKTSPEDLLSGLLFRLASLEVDLIAMQGRATVAGDVRGATEAIRQRRALIRDTAIIGEKVGYFGGFRWLPPDNEVKDRDILLEAVRLASDPTADDKMFVNLFGIDGCEDRETAEPERFY